LQHPAQGGAEQGDHQTDAQEWMAEDALAKRKKNALRRRIHGGVGGLLKYVKIFKVYPHGMGWIGEAVVREGVGGEQEAEFIVDGGIGDGLYGEDGDAGRKSQNADEKNGQDAPLRYAAE
jgi:hypothetical protein